MEIEAKQSLDDHIKDSDSSTKQQHEDLPPLPEAPEDWYRVVLWKGDGFDPLSWSNGKKFVSAAILIASNFVALLGSAMLSPGTAQVSEDFHVGTVVATLGAVSLYVLGFATGPIFFGPMSEILGRKIPLVLAMFLYTCFSFAVATCKDIQTFSITRFFMGVSGACILTLVPAGIGDIFPIKTRAFVMSITVGTFMSGPMIGPLISGYVVHSYLRWRWTMYLNGIIGAFIGLLMIFFLPESFAPVIARNKAAKLRKDTGLWPLFAPIEREQLEIGAVAKKVLLRPFILLATEPILLLISVYMGFVYSIEYLALSAVPIVFGETYGWPGGNQFLPYIGMLTGDILITVVNILIFNPLYLKRLENRKQKIWPEGHLPAMLVTSVALPVGLFLFTWSGAYQVHWIVPTIGLGFVGCSVVGMFLGGISYIVECFTSVSASAVAANVFTRSAIGASMPIYAAILFHNLGTQWAGTLLGCLGALLAPIPICFYLFGSKIRKWSKHTVKDEDVALAFKDIHEAPELKQDN